MFGQNFQARSLGDFHDRVLSAAWACGQKFSSEAMHVYMGKNMFSLWSYHIGTVFKSIKLSFHIYSLSNHHLVHDIHQTITPWTTQFIQQISMSRHILHFLRWILAWEHQNIPAALWWLMWHSNTLQLPSKSCSSPPYVMIMSRCSEGGFR